MKKTMILLILLMTCMDAFAATIGLDEPTNFGPQRKEKNTKSSSGSSTAPSVTTYSGSSTAPSVTTYSGSSTTPSVTTYSGSSTVVSNAHTNSDSSSQCQNGYGQNLIKNGGFEMVKNRKNFPQKIAVADWNDNQMSTGYLQNFKLANNQMNNAFMFDEQIETCIKQKVKLKKNRGKLTFDWSTIEKRGKCSTLTCQLKVKLGSNSLLVLTTNGQSQWKGQVSNIQYNPSKQIYLEFCGRGKINQYGIYVDNIMLTQFNQCPVANIHSY